MKNAKNYLPIHWPKGADFIPHFCEKTEKCGMYSILLWCRAART